VAKQFNIHEAKTHFSELLQRAHAGEEIVIAKAGRAYARLVPIRDNEERRPGILRGELQGDALAPLDEEELARWT
jgi:prevent-host-death family protein